VTDPRASPAQLAAPLVRFLVDLQKANYPHALLFGVSYPLELVIRLREYRALGRSRSDRRVPELIVSHSLLSQDQPNPFERTLRLRRAQESGMAVTGAELQGYVDAVTLYLRVYFEGPDQLPEYGRLSPAQRELSEASSDAVSRWVQQTGLHAADLDNEHRFAATVVGWLSGRSNAQWHTLGLRTGFDTIFAHVDMLKAVEAGSLR
jgi:hypothetical protein